MFGISCYASVTGRYVLSTRDCTVPRPARSHRAVKSKGRADGAIRAVPALRSFPSSFLLPRRSAPMGHQVCQRALGTPISIFWYLKTHQSNPTDLYASLCLGYPSLGCPPDKRLNFSQGPARTLDLLKHIPHSSFPAPAAAHAAHQCCTSHVHCSHPLTPPTTQPSQPWLLKDKALPL